MLDLIGRRSCKHLSRLRGFFVAAAGGGATLLWRRPHNPGACWSVLEENLQATRKSYTTTAASTIVAAATTTTSTRAPTDSTLTAATSTKRHRFALVGTTALVTGALIGGTCIHRTYCSTERSSAMTLPRAFHKGSVEVHLPSREKSLHLHYTQWGDPQVVTCTTTHSDVVIVIHEPGRGQKLSLVHTKTGSSILLLHLSYRASPSSTFQARRVMLTSHNCTCCLTSESKGNERSTRLLRKRRCHAHTNALVFG